MKILILTLGTQGDVQPYVALALGLKKSGHDVTVATATDFEHFITARGLNYFPLRVNLHELVNSFGTKKSIAVNPFRAGRGLKAITGPYVRRILDDSWAAAQGSDAIVYHPLVFGGYHIAEKLDLPCFASVTFPLLSPTGEFPNPMFPNLKLGSRVNRISYFIMPLFISLFRGSINKWRKEVLSLPPRSFLSLNLERKGRPLPVLYCYSPRVFPSPADWDSSTIATGYWFLDLADGWEPPRGLVDFIEKGPPPVYIGFGSMPSKDPAKVTEIVLSALDKAGARGVIATGWGGMRDKNLPSFVYKIESAPHDWLFPRMAAVVHHGGAGTVAAGLRAGKPAVICPFAFDQHFWGKVVFELGAGPKPIPQKRLSIRNLAEAIHIAMTDETMRRRAEETGEKIRAENGVTRAVEIINATLSNGV